MGGVGLLPKREEGCVCYTMELVWGRGVRDEQTSPFQPGETRATVPTRLSSEWCIRDLTTQAAHELLMTECCGEDRVGSFSSRPGYGDQCQRNS